MIRFDQTLVSENEWLHVDIVHDDMIFLMFFQSLDAVKLLETYCASMMSGRFVVNFQMRVESGLNGKSSWTESALKWLILIVNTDMPNQI